MDVDNISKHQDNLKKKKHGWDTLESLSSYAVSECKFT